MVDAERLLALLGRVTSRLAVLDGYAEDARVDAAQHVVAARGLGTPASNAEAFRLLERAGILAADVATSLAGAVGFRNVLVHGYAEVDDRLVIDNLRQLPALRSFVTAMTALLGD